MNIKSVVVFFVLWFSSFSIFAGLTIDSGDLGRYNSYFRRFDTDSYWFYAQSYNKIDDVVGIYLNFAHGFTIYLGKYNYKTNTLEDDNIIVSILKKSQEWVKKAIDNKIDIKNKPMFKVSFADIVPGYSFKSDFLMTINYKDMNYSSLIIGGVYKFSLNSSLYKLLISVFLNNDYNQKFKKYYENYKEKTNSIFN